MAHLLIKDLPDSERPRERLMKVGPENLKTTELIAILLRTGTKGNSALTVAENLLQKFPNLDQLAKASVDQLRQIKGIGQDKAIALQTAFTLAKRMAAELHQ